MGVSYHPARRDGASTAGERGRVVTVPRRILVVGSSGAGRSTIARALADRYGLPVIHTSGCPAPT
ncbi:hypothetical protein GCM10022220_60140 [Actinocatenispora rupis]|uniref:Uncharacterized protein n=1 Tax=Actinocatenispora rupis TaxID=519421 RepID=A0A8J3NC67_9ACTN|nr:hypothetical protein Aru02nite_46500 [Actinocatenispora rupis]